MPRHASRRAVAVAVAVVFPTALAVGVVTAVVAPASAGASALLPESFTFNGPSGIDLGPRPAADGRISGPVSGAINALVPDPGDENVAWIGSVNGGVWKTVDAASPGGPTWTPETDHQSSLAIASLSLDPTFADPSCVVPDASRPCVLVAGLGHSSSYAAALDTANLDGVLRSVDGGVSWTRLGADLIGHNVFGVQARGSDIVVGTDDGVLRSTDTGVTFHHVAGVPFGHADEVEGTAADPQRLYAALSGTGGGVFTSPDGGATWQSAGGATFGQPAGPDLVAGSRRLQVSASASSPNIVYAALVGANKDVSAVFRSADFGAHWTPLEVPPNIDKALQARLSIIADPTSSHLLYLGGDEDTGVAPIFRCDTTQPVGAQCVNLDNFGSTLDGSGTHEDSRRLVFDHDGNLLDADDGGIFKHTGPLSIPSAGIWNSLDGNLAITEGHSCVYDHVTRLATCGTQDNGTIRQHSPGSPGRWDEIGGGDGGMVALSASDTQATEYFSGAKLRGFARSDCTAGPNCNISNPALTVLPDGVPLNMADASLDDTLYTPVAANVTDPNSLVIGTQTVYESADGGNTLHRLPGFVDSTGHALVATRAIAMGATGLPGLLYVGGASKTASGLFFHGTKFAPLTRLPAYPGGAPLDIALDPAGWQSNWVIDSNSVLHTTDGGQTWTDVTGDLGSGAGARSFGTVAVIPAASSTIVLVGASDGLYASSTANPTHWYKLGGALPNAMVFDLNYDATDDLLLISAPGRSTWTMHHASEMLLPAVVDASASDSSADFDDVAHLSARLTDGNTGAPMSNEPIHFGLGSQGCDATTGSTGVAHCQITIAQDPGTYQVSATFAGDGPLPGAYDTRPFTVLAEESAVTYTGPGAGDFNDAVTVSADLTDPSDGSPIAGQPITFVVGSSSLDRCTGVSNAAGAASCQITLTQLPGSFTLTATFAATTQRLGSSTTAPFSINKEDTALTYTGAAGGDYHDPVAVSAVLRDRDDGTPIADETVTFKIGSSSSDTCSAKTIASGAVACVLTPTQVSASYPLTVSFATTPHFLGSSTTAPFAIAHEETTLGYTGPTVIANTAATTFSAVLREDGVTPIAGRHVTIMLGSGTTVQSCMGTTLTTGTASCTITPHQPASATSTPLTASFAGDGFYLASEQSATLLLGYETGRAFGIASSGLVAIKPTPDTGAISTSEPSTTAPPCTASLNLALVAIQGLCVKVTTVASPASSAAQSTVVAARIGAPGVPLITLRAVSAQSASSCSATGGLTSIGYLRIGSTVLVSSVLRPATNRTISLPGLVKVVLNEQLPVAGADRGLTVNAVHITITGVLDLRIGSATSDVHNCIPTGQAASQAVHIEQPAPRYE